MTTTTPVDADTGEILVRPFAAFLRHLDTAAKEEGTGFSLIHPDRVMDVLRFAVMSGAYAGLTDAGVARDAAAARAAKIAWSAPGEKLALLAMSPLTGRAP